MNKYQEALDIEKKNYWICPDEYKDEYIKEKEEIFETLQELIDNYYELEDKMQKQGNSYGNRILYSKQLEKALDKAVDVISSIKGMTIRGLGDSNYSWNESVRVALFSEEATFEINNGESEKQNERR